MYFDGACVRAWEAVSCLATLAILSYTHHNRGEEKNYNKKVMVAQKVL